ncbi:hypothetical protein KCU83_g340, partial [Aureobasidium melanogenum]
MGTRGGLVWPFAVPLPAFFFFLGFLFFFFFAAPSSAPSLAPSASSPSSSESTGTHELAPKQYARHFTHGIQRSKRVKVAPRSSRARR